MEGVSHRTAENRFELECEGGPAVLDFQIDGDSMVITRTFVPSVCRGRGLAAALVRAAFAHARNGRMKVVPRCSYVETYFRRHPEDADLRA